MLIISHPYHIGNGTLRTHHTSLHCHWSRSHNDTITVFCQMLCVCEENILSDISGVTSSVGSWNTLSCSFCRPLLCPPPRPRSKEQRPGWRAARAAGRVCDSPHCPRNQWPPPRWIQRPAQPLWLSDDRAQVIFSIHRGYASSRTQVTSHINQLFSSKCSQVKFIWNTQNINAMLYIMQSVCKCKWVLCISM